MGTQTAKRRLFCAFLAIGMAAIGCRSFIPSSVGDIRTETQSVDPGSASSARVQIEMDAGELDVQGGSDGLMDATFRYNVDVWQPQVSYDVNGSQGELLVTQPNSEISLAPNQFNEWTLKLSDTIPLDIRINTGAGESILDFSSLDLTGLRVETGAGKTDLDLGGVWDHDVSASVNGGVGAIIVHLPGEMGAQVRVQSGLVGVTTSGLERDGNTYVNQAFGSSPYTLYLDVEAGVGGIELVAP